ncbi:hypothetical protein LSH36_1371g00022 [Paralvinella palmiformis]|uniref:Uncharacterized protein n=1 Tax=Paralvinella palmiformis TaxID=53620 RepID=A0AAD9ISY2_9ANNE|nr:hypothetical protein LSH36_1371g00022 [Paralvinella palmiformis]
MKKIVSTTSDVHAYTHFENLDCYMSTGDKPSRLCVIYGPPPSKQNCFTNTVFVEEWSSYLDELAVAPQQLIITDPFLVNTRGNSSVDHMAIHMKLDIGKPKSKRKEITFRKPRAIPVLDFIKDIDSTPSLQYTSGSVDDLISAYDSGIRRLIDKHTTLQNSGEEQN